MKLKIRQGVFETNSSSVHSISIGQAPYNENIYDNEDIVINVKDYLDTTEVINKPENRASYLLATVNHLDEDLKKWETKIEERFKAFGAKNVTINGTGRLYSDYLADNFLDNLRDNVIELDNYLFGDTIILIDNDNRAELEKEAEELGMPYDLEYRSLKRYQFRIY